MYKLWKKIEKAYGNLNEFSIVGVSQCRPKIRIYKSECFLGF